MDRGMDLERLPRLARLAYAARCARRVQPLLTQFSPDTPDEFLRAVDRAIALAERSAAEGGQCAGLADAAEEAERRARGAVGVARAFSSETGQTSPALAAPVRRAVAYAGAAAAWAALETSVRAAARAVTYAAEAVCLTKAADVEAAMASDFQGLRDAFGHGGWDDDRPVAPEFFTPL